MLASRENFPLLTELLAEQQRLDTPVARFATAHDAGSCSLPAGRSNLSSQLIPLSQPRAGEHYAFEVDLDSCTGCKSCVAACHSLNGLDETETWRDVGLLVSSDRRHPFAQTVTTACHHCADPACLNGCPVLAYEKDPVTGIVRHLDDQCIGCSYCILKCPYDVPKFSRRLGIVRKCDMCHDRLAHGEAPACAQACPTHAIRIIAVADEIQKPVTEKRNDEGRAVVARAAHSPVAGFLPAAPDPAYTQPTTRYVSRRKLPADLVAADGAALKPQPPHWPLVALLILMALAIGCGVADKILAPRQPVLALLGWIAGTGGLAFSVLHLGQPRRAWRIFLGLRKSWLSREAIVFGAWFPLATTCTLARLGWLPSTLPPFQRSIAVATATLGTLGLFCSVMIYVDTRRQFWRFACTAPRFFGSAVLLGLAGALAAGGPSRLVGLGLAVATAAKLLFEAHALEPLNGDRDIITPRRQTALLLVGPLRATNEFRIGAALLGGVVAPLYIVLGHAPAAVAWLAFGAVLAGEIAERYLFFRAVDAPKMPGMPA